MTPNGIRVRTLLLWLVLAASLPLLLFSAGAVRWVLMTHRQQQETTLVDQARNASERIDQALQRVQDGLSALAASTALPHGDLAGFAQEMRPLSRLLGNLPLTLAAADGSVRVRVAETDPPVNLEALRQATAAAMEAQGQVITNLLPAGDPAQREIAIAVPVYGPGSTRPGYALVAEIDGTRLEGYAAMPPSSPDGLVTTIRDRDGVVAIQSPPADQQIGEPAPSNFRGAVAGRPFGPLPDRTTLDGIPVAGAFSVMRTSGYTVIVALPQNLLGARTRWLLIQALCVGVVLLIIGLSAAAFLGRRLVRSLQAIEHDEASFKPSGLREVDELAGRLCAVSKAREATEITLRDSENRLRDLIGTLDLAAIMVRDLDGTIRFWSHGCARMYGWPRELAVGQPAHELLRTQFPVPQSQIEATLRKLGDWKGDLVHRRRDGSSIIVAAQKVLKRDLDGRPLMVMESLVDVTALREAQDTLRTLNHDLELQVRNEVAAREAAQGRAAHADRIQAIGQLAGGIAHDFNNVLQAVAGGAALISRRPEDLETVSRLARIVGDAAARGASITRRMLLLARRGDLRAEPLEVRSLLAGMQEVFVHTIGAEINVQVEAASSLPRLLADKAQLETALVNLATNARDAMPDGGTLRLKAGLEVVGQSLSEPHPAGLRPNTYIRLCVIDDGNGMSPATLSRIGEPFFTTKDVGKGTGLGLSMVKGFADQSGGGFAIESAVAGGTKATIWLPCVQDDARLRHRERAVEHRLPLTGRILLVDDDTLVRDTVTDQLEELGHKVLAASCGTDALAILRAREAIDLMITDLSMPGMNGLTLIKEAHGLRPSLPTILLTGYAGDSAALDKGATPRSSYSLMRKPATSVSLGARVTAMLDR